MSSKFWNSCAKYRAADHISNRQDHSWLGRDFNAHVCSSDFLKLSGNTMPFRINKPTSCLVTNKDGNLLGA